ncbi:MAG: hypothetical protein ABJB01_01320 [Rudaea sp.]
MSDQNARPELTLGDALRALPLQAPRADVWASLAKELAPRKRRARFVWPAAIAACALAAFIVIASLRHVAPPATATVAASSSSYVANDTGNTMNAANALKATNVQLTALQSRSRELEQWLHETAGIAAPLPGRDLAAAGEIESLIGIIDVELAAPQSTHEEELWRRRVNLLEDLTALRYSNYRLAESGATGNAAQPTTWIN